MDVISN